jgi:hypothetical protein
MRNSNSKRLIDFCGGLTRAIRGELRQLTEPLRKRETRQEERGSLESVSRRFWRRFFGFQRDVLGRRGASGRNERCPCHSRFGFEIRRFSRDWRNSDQVMATGALNFAAGKSLIAKEMLLAEWTGEFEFAHTILASHSECGKPS